MDLRISVLKTISLLFLILPGIGLADNPYGSASVSGFYTFDMSYSVDGDRAIGTKKNTPLTIEKDDLNFNNSVIGLQFDWLINDNFSFTAQGVSTGQTNGNYDPELEWAYLSYDLGSDTSLHFGKRKVPFHHGAELRYVGASRLWTRPVVPSTGAGGFDQYSGLELSKSYFYDDFNITYQAVYGETEHGLENTHGDKIALLSARADNQHGWLKLVLLRTNFDVYTPRNPQLIKSDALAHMASLEMELNFHPWIINAGASYEDIDINPDGRWLYLSIGHRFDQLTPYFLVQNSRLSFDVFAPPAPPPRAGPGPGPGPGLGPRPGLGSRPGAAPLPPSPPDGEIKSTTFAVGMRYDVSPTSALKSQVERWQEKSQLQTQLPATESDSTLFTLTFEGVF